jgi:UDP-N-acetylmuramate dehydrogenase
VPAAQLVSARPLVDVDEKGGASPMLGSICGDIRFKEPLSVHTSLRLGGPADIFIAPENVDDIRHALRFAEREQMPVTVVGTGTHLLVTERGFRGVVLKLDGALRRVEFHGHEAVAGAGAEVFALVRAAAALSLGGLTHLGGASGTVGGALVVHGHNLSQALASLVSAVYVIRQDGELDEVKAPLDGLGDHPPDMSGRILIACRLRLARQPSGAITREINQALRARPLLQTLTFAAAAVWKDPPGQRAGFLIEQAGLTGKRINAAEICVKHPSVIVNRGAATAVDVLALMELTRERVFDRTGIRLQPAIRTLGDPL